MSQTPSASSHEISLTNAAFLVAGTCIGGGILLLPVVSGQAGFMPTTWTMCLIWAAMTITALCLVELGLWLSKKNSHVISLANAYLGTPGKVVAWVLFLFMSYASIIAYIAGSGHYLAKGLSAIGFSCSKESGCILFSLLFAPFIFLPHTKLATLNTLLFYGMIVAYVGIIATGAPFIQKENLEHTDWSSLYKAVPLILTSFSFQTMVPSLPPLLGYNRRKLYIACIVGTFIPLVSYILWQAVILGAVPLTGPNGLLEAYVHGTPATDSLVALSQSTILSVSLIFFAFLALVTSFLGLGMGLFDFLADGLHISKSKKGRIILTLLVLLPSLFFAITYERAFIEALDATGGFGDAILNGLLPLFMMVFGVQRYLVHKEKKVRFIYALLAITALIFLTSFGCELYSRLENQVLTVPVFPES